MLHYNMNMEAGIPKLSACEASHAGARSLVIMDGVRMTDDRDIGIETEMYNQEALVNQEARPLQGQGCNLRASAPRLVEKLGETPELLPGRP